MMVQIYVDDIIFGSIDPKLTVEFKTLMETKFEMPSMGPINFFSWIKRSSEQRRCVYQSRSIH